MYGALSLNLVFGGNCALEKLSIISISITRHGGLSPRRLATPHWAENTWVLRHFLNVTFAGRGVTVHVTGVFHIGTSQRPAGLKNT